ncbi:hypothetical protein ANN_19310 [Periplaneta americana]|uniref:Uncharacterized protein n=1 Tax=Periplaneta americana TaxID=6978 RepID=A0ABQ8S9L6_PERAM|nr:hypothetical protein ANN_19310 [Periplaneta americana]
MPSREAVPTLNLTPEQSQRTVSPRNIRMEKRNLKTIVHNMLEEDAEINEVVNCPKTGLDPTSDTNKASLMRSNSERNISDIDIDIPDIVYYSYAPITSCDVERSFSRYIFCLNERRRTFTFDNLRMYIIVHCNAQTTQYSLYT